MKSSLQYVCVTIILGIVIPSVPSWSQTEEAVLFQNRSFRTPSRSRELENYPCHSCHDEKMNTLHLGRDIQHQAHWNIQLQHTRDSVLSCGSCHASENMDQLKLLDKRLVSFDQSHQVCAQCHFKEAKDWAFGAHGKRLGRWDDLPLIQQCSSCHNPHQPAIKNRWPVSYPGGLKGEINDE